MRLGVGLFNGQRAWGLQASHGFSQPPIIMKPPAQYNFGNNLRVGANASVQISVGPITSDSGNSNCNNVINLLPQKSASETVATKNPTVEQKESIKERQLELMASEGLTEAKARDQAVAEFSHKA